MKKDSSLHLSRLLCSLNDIADNDNREWYARNASPASRL